MDAQQTRKAIDDIKNAIRADAETEHDKQLAEVFAGGLDLLCGFLLDVKTIAEGVGRSDDAILAVAARKARELDQ